MSGQNAATSGANNTGGTSNTDAATAAAENTSGQTGATTGANNNTAGQTDASTSDTGKISFTPEQQAYINSLVKDEKTKAVSTFQKKADEEKNLSAQQIAEKERDEAKAEVAERDKKDAFKETTAGAKIVDANALYKLIGGELEFENGKFKNLTKVLDTAKVSYPYLFKKVEAAADGGKEDETAQIDVKPGVDRMRNAYASSEKE